MSRVISLAGEKKTTISLAGEKKTTISLAGRAPQATTRRIVPGMWTGVRSAPTYTRGSNG